MARRKRSKKKGNDAVNFLLLLFLLGAGGMTGWNGCSETDNPDHTGNTENTGKPGANHYPDLETVSIPKGLTSQIKEYTGFTVSFNKDNGTPNYVAWSFSARKLPTMFSVMIISGPIRISTDAHLQRITHAQATTAVTCAPPPTRNGVLRQCMTAS